MCTSFRCGRSDAPEFAGVHHLCWCLAPFLTFHHACSAFVHLCVIISWEFNAPTFTHAHALSHSNITRRHTRSDIQHEFSGLRFQQQLLSEYRRDLRSLRVSKRQSIEEKAFLREAWVIFAIQADSMYSTELCVSVAMEFRGCCCWYHA